MKSCNKEKKTYNVVINNFIDTFDINCDAHKYKYTLCSFNIYEQYD